MAYEIRGTADLRGEGCPSGYERVLSILEILSSGDHIEFILDEGDSMVNVPVSLKEDGHQVVKVAAHEDGAAFVVLVRKGLSPRVPSQTSP